MDTDLPLDDAGLSGKEAHKAHHKRLHRLANLTIAVHPGDDVQAALDACPPFGVIHFAPGIHTFDRLSITKPVTLQGSGAYTPRTAGHNVSTWRSTAHLEGSMLVTTVTDGVAIDNAVEVDGVKVKARLVMRDIGVVCAADNDTTGIKSFASGQVTWTDVSLHNFGIGLDMAHNYMAHYQTLRLLSCALGVRAVVCNGANFSNLIATACDVGLRSESSTLSIHGGALQGTLDTGLVFVGAEENSVSGIYFESSVSNYAIHAHEGADRLDVRGCHFGDSGSNILIESNWNTVKLGKYVGGTVTLTGKGNRIETMKHVTVVDAGYQNTVNVINDWALPT